MINENEREIMMKIIARMQTLSKDEEFQREVDEEILAYQARYGANWKARYERDIILLGKRSNLKFRRDKAKIDKLHKERKI